MSRSAGYRNNVRISERHGAGEWVTEKVALLLLMPLGVWVAWSLYSLTGKTYEVVSAWFANMLNAGLLAITAVVFFGFISLAWKVIIEDYIHKPGTKSLLVNLVNIICLVLAAASVFFIVRLALGSAPLPAGV